MPRDASHLRRRDRRLIANIRGLLANIHTDGVAAGGKALIKIERYQQQLVALRERLRGYRVFDEANCASNDHGRTRGRGRPHVRCHHARRVTPAQFLWLVRSLRLTIHAERETQLLVERLNRSHDKSARLIRESLELIAIHRPASSR